MKTPNGFVEKATTTIVVLTVITYIATSIIRRFGNNNHLLIIPLCIAVANFFILIELLYVVRVKKVDCSKKNWRILLSQSILNFLFILYILSFFFLK